MKIARQTAYRVAAVALGVAIALVAWDRYPWTKDSCYWLAAKQPTEQGVMLAADSCAYRFGQPGGK